MEKPEKIVGVIPARYASTRFPGKVLARINDKPMIFWVHEGASKSKRLDDLYVATDDERVKQETILFGGKVIMTSSQHLSGTDRVAEAADNFDADVIVNIQGDEPLISPQAIDEVLEPFYHDDHIGMATLCRRAKNPEEIIDPNTVRVVFDNNFDALYFSRATIPFNRDLNLADWLKNSPYYQHIGIYAYRKHFLAKLTKLPQTQLEKTEKLEQLRVLESGYKIRVVETHYNPVCVDVAEDIEKVEILMKTIETENG